jgi:hypothetical protein
VIGSDFDRRGLFFENGTGQAIVCVTSVGGAVSLVVLHLGMNWGSARMLRAVTEDQCVLLIRSHSWSSLKNYRTRGPSLLLNYLLSSCLSLLHLILCTRTCVQLVCNLCACKSPFDLSFRGFQVWRKVNCSCSASPALLSHLCRCASSRGVSVELRATALVQRL